MRRTAKRHRPKRPQELSLERLEERQLLAVVTSAADSGLGTLRHALSTGDPTIAFDVNAMGTSTVMLATGDLVIDHSVTIDGDDGAGGHVTVNAGGVGRAFYIDNPATVSPSLLETVTLKNLVITGGNSGGVNTHGSYQDGGGILNFENLTLDDVTLTNNVAPERGGGVGHGVGGGRVAGLLTIVNSTINGNTAQSGSGGGIYIYGSNGAITATDSVVSGNSAEFGGGGIYNYGYYDSPGEPLSFVGTTISNNSAKYGGGIVNRYAPLHATDSVISDNSATSEGGGIWNTSGDVELLRTSVSGNTSGDEGGGIWNLGIDSSYALHLTESTVANNSSGDHGGGIWNREASLSILTTTISGNRSSNRGGGIFHKLADLDLTDSTVSNNTSNAVGGGLYLHTDRFQHDVQITNATISRNLASLRGGGVYNDRGATSILNSTITLNRANFEGDGVLSRGDDMTVTSIGSSIVSDNVFGQGPDDVHVQGATNTFVSAGFNVIGSGSGVPNFTNNDQTGVNDPGLAALADNGGPTQTHALTTSSVALDAGSNPLNLALDQRGAPFARSQGDGVDVGAFEHQQSVPFNLVVDTDVDEDDGDYGVGDLSMREAVGLANLNPDSNQILFDNVFFSTPRTISLTMGEIPITEPVAIIGAGQVNAIVDAQGMSRVFNVDDHDSQNLINVRIAGLTITGGSAIASGGAILNREDLLLDFSVVSNNTAAHHGGGVWSPSGDVFLNFCSITGNSAGSRGGGLYVKDGGFYALKSTISNNSSQGGGGGIRIEAANAATIKDTTISDNTALAGYGGGINIADTVSHTVTITSSTISGNTAELGGGAYHDGQLEIRYSTITNNHSTAVNVGNGVYALSASSTTTVANSIIAGNGNSDVDSAIASFVSDGYNVIGSGNQVASFTNNDQTAVTDPMLGPLTLNGGPVETHEVLATSPALNMGDPAFVEPPHVDQRGQPRVSGGRIDVGSFERQIIPAGGDFNGDGLHDSMDIDALVAVIAAATHDLSFDLTGDGAVDLADRDAWLAEAGGVNLGPGKVYLLGDATLDGVVDGADFVRWNSNKFSSVAAWSHGDFNADGLVDGRDFVIWNMNKFTSSDTAGSGFHRGRHDADSGWALLNPIRIPAAPRDWSEEFGVFDLSDELD